MNIDLLSTSKSSGNVVICKHCTILYFLLTLTRLFLFYLLNLRQSFQKYDLTFGWFFVELGVGLHGVCVLPNPGSTGPGVQI